MNIPAENIKKALNCLAQCEECKGSECDYYMDDNPVCDCDNVSIAKETLEYIKYLEEKCRALTPKWISIKERKPDKELEEHNGNMLEVLVIIKDAELATTLLYDGKSFFDYDFKEYKVAYWQPIPKTPNKEIKNEF